MHGGSQQHSRLVQELLCDSVVCWGGDHIVDLSARRVRDTPVAQRGELLWRL